ncbi:substrate-binding domain-containing protein [Robiginitalea marina]|uniref:Substrate-binding domain-containing protein n=1 Tax=Robiginitalea marina TaxID=2954105 RepID=A0ABT1AV61_9FLAO|nr:substrate-binding domain-containing protein [Robiginitalea marina]MCO5723492.1 substrate-binding domain-containing protein [Robiginitalea marina]
MNTAVRIVGVPEHFNLPWLMALEEGAFSARGIDLQWTDVPEGTGKMAEMLRAGKADLAVILTEGLVKAVSDGTPAQIAQEFIASSLHWGIHVHQSSPYRTESELAGKTAAISRYGSGSHLMAFIHAENQGWPLESLRFEVVNTLEGAVSALASGTADYFMWERFTTQPLVDQGVFRRIGVCPTPWPCFVIACTEEFGRKAPGVLSDLLEIINTFTVEFRDIPSIDRTLALRYKQALEGIREWLAITRWSQSQIKRENLENVISTLSHLNLISNKLSIEALMWKP